ncbi:MAG TPA: ABC transporter permease [Vicinamibacterales bacterium]|nr:ABC transporter permease [Vicinamibacterales bacterium]
MKTWLESLGQDLHYGVRGLRRSPGFAAAAIILLALGIGANTAIFSLVRAVVLRPLPFPDPDRLVLIWDDFSANRGPTRANPSPADYVAWKEQGRSFADMAAFIPNTYNLTGTGEPAKLSGMRTMSNIFALLGMQPILGRTLDSADERPDAAPVVVLSERLWRSRFGADPTLIGRTIALNGMSHTVVGIVPPDFQFPDKEAVVWVPARFTPQELAESGNYYFFVLARLKPEAPLLQAQAEMQAIARRLEQQYPATKNRLRISVTPLHEHLTREARPTMAMLLGAVGLVLLTACANLANLLLARAAARRKEIALRKVLGAGHARLTRQLMTESAVLAVIGSALGIALSAVTFSYLARLLPGSLPATSTLRIDSSVMLFTAGVAALIVVAIGSAPALAAVRTGLEAALRSSSGRNTGASRRLRSLLVIAEITMTVVLLVGAGLLFRSYANVLAVEPGFNPQHVLLAETVLPPSRYGTPESRTRFCDGVLERVTALPGVIRAAYVNYPPLTFKGGRALMSIEGRPAPQPEEFTRFIVSDRVISAGYFATLDVPVLRGREFEARDAAGTPFAVIINAKVAQQHFSNQDPIGQRIKIGNPAGPNPWLTIVGVVGDMRQYGIDTAPEPEIYFAANQNMINVPFFWPQQLVMRTAGDPLALAAAVRRAVWAVDADEPVSRIQSMSQVFDTELLNRNTQLTLIAAFALLTLLIAAVGLYAVLSYSVAQQLREIGVRMALGARRMTVVVGVVRSAALLTTTGVAIGLGAAFAGARLLQSWLFEVGSTDPLTFAGTALLLCVTALVATVVPAFRGASIDPTVVLRME